MFMQHVHNHAMAVAPAKSKRLRLIEQLLPSERVESQEQLQRLLEARGVRANQATLSRDLRALGVLKTAEGYRLPGDAGVSESAAVSRRDAVAAFVLSVDAVGPMVVVRTGPGHAQAAAIELDRSPPKGVGGIIAGDDTIFCATASPRVAADASLQLRRWAGLA